MKQVTQAELDRAGLEAASCATCPGACCREGLKMPLKAVEARQLEAAGTILRLLTSEETQGNRLSRGEQYYIFESDCGNLTEDSEGSVSCGDYVNRPSICRDFTENSFACHSVRITSGVVEPVTVEIPRYDREAAARIVT